MGTAGPEAARPKAGRPKAGRPKATGPRAARPRAARPRADGTEAGRRELAARPRADRRELAAIFAGGALGTLLRAGLASAFPHPATSWPWPTFTVNVVAALVLGYAVTRLQERLPLSSYRRPLLGTGLCGGLSTFSTIPVEILKMTAAHAWGLAAGYALAMIACGYGAIYLATAMVRRVRVQVRART
jgi:fluoride exporter